MTVHIGMKSDVPITKNTIESGRKFWIILGPKRYGPFTNRNFEMLQGVAFHFDVEKQLIYCMPAGSESKNRQFTPADLDVILTNIAGRFQTESFLCRVKEYVYAGTGIRLE